MTTGCCGKDVGVVANEMFKNLSAKQFGITVTSKTPSIRTSIGLEETESH
jgi:hypothetical protein